MAWGVQDEGRTEMKWVKNDTLAVTESLDLNCAGVSILAVACYYSFLRHLYWQKLGKRIPACHF